MTRDVARNAAQHPPSPCHGASAMHLDTPGRLLSSALVAALLLSVACGHGPAGPRARGEAPTACPSDLLGAIGDPCSPEGATCGAATATGPGHLLMCTGGVWSELEVLAPPPPPPPPAPQRVDLSVFDRACSADADCELVRAASCGDCECEVDALPVRERPRYLAALREVACPPVAPMPPSGRPPCPACPSLAARCENGACAARPR